MAKNRNKKRFLERSKRKIETFCETEKVVCFGCSFDFVFVIFKGLGKLEKSNNISLV